MVRTRRRDPNNPNGTEEDETPGTSVLDILSDATYGNPQSTPSQTSQSRPSVSGPSGVAPSPATNNSSNNNNIQRPTTTAIPPRTSIASTSALTPPEETAPHTRKRFLPADGNANNTAAGSSTGGNGDKRRRTDPLQVHPPAWAATAAAAGVGSTVAPSQDGLSVLAEAIKSARGRTGWSEQALDIFFRDFGGEDMDLQLKIAEKALTDDNKAMVFCKMPVSLRKHWVKRLREVHNRNA